MINREVKAVGWFLLLYVVFNVLLYTGFLLREEQLMILMHNWSPVIRLTVFFLLQEVVIVTMLFCIRKKVVGQTRLSLISTLRERRQWKGWGHVWKWVVWGLVVYFVLNSMILASITWLEWEIPGLYGEQMVISLLGGLSLQARWEYALVGSIVVFIWPFIEELIFRGIITHTFMEQRAFQWIVLAALVFAAIHGERAVVRNLVILSLFLGIIYRKTWSMWYSFLFHLGINGLALLVLMLGHLYPELMDATLALLYK